MDYLRLLRRPHIALLLCSATVARLPAGVNGLALLLFLKAERGSYAEAGLVVGAMTLGNAVGGPWQGRLVDRRGTAPLVPLAFAYGVGLAACLWLGARGIDIWAVAGVALVSGAILPGTIPVLRAAWPRLLDDSPGLLSVAYALDSLLIEVLFVSGPLLVGLSVLLGGPLGALAISTVGTVIGTIAFVVGLGWDGRSLEPDPEVAGRGLLAVLFAPGIRILTLVSLPLGFYVGCVEVVLPAFSEGIGKPAAAGLLLATFAAVSGLAGFFFGIYRKQDHLWPHLAWSLSLAVTSLPLLGADALAVGVATAGIAGMPIAPTIISRNEILRGMVPGGAAVEAFSWPLTAMISGVSLGAAVGGTLIEWGGRSAPLLLASAGALAAAAVVACRTGELRRGEISAAEAQAID